jgi:hypothetical protein
MLHTGLGLVLVRTNSNQETTLNLFLGLGQTAVEVFITYCTHFFLRFVPIYQSNYAYDD